MASMWRGRPSKHAAESNTIRRARRTPDGVVSSAERAVIIAVGWDRETPYLPPRELLPLGPKAVITHVLDQAAEAGVHHAEIIVGDFADELAAFVGDGSRWGLTVSYHVVADARRPHEAVLQIAHEAVSDDARPILLLNTERLRLPAEQTIEDVDPGRFRVWVDEQSDLAAATVPRHFLIEFGAESLSYTDWQKRIVDLAGLIEGAVNSCAVASLTTPREFIASQKAYFSAAERSNWQVPGHVESEVWIGRGAAIHPTARLVAPVYVGDSAEISAGAVVGPNVTLAEHTLVGVGSHIEHSVVAAGSQLGDRLHVRESFIAHGAAYHTLHRAGLPLDTRLLISDVAVSKVGTFLTTLRDACYAFATLVVAPLCCVAGEIQFRLGRCSRVRFGRASSDYRRHFWAEVFPRLADVLAGNARLFGSSSMVTREGPLRDPSPLCHLTQRGGLISEALVRFGPDHSRRQGLSIALEQALTNQPRRLGRLWLRYLRSLVPIGEQRSVAAPTSARSTESHQGSKVLREPKLVRVYASVERGHA